MSSAIVRSFYEMAEDKSKGITTNRKLKPPFNKVLVIRGQGKQGMIERVAARHLTAK